MAIQTITGTPGSGMQMPLFSDLPKQQPGLDWQIKHEYRYLLLYAVNFYHDNRNASPYKRHLSRFEHDRAANLIHQLGGLSAAW